ncbi:MAG: phosphoribosylformylglycinamidine synthase, partial [Eggerthellaceae bacterium]|nr:phosphoribosylformylglycinamidine synthase [Eggerthellaceae bacterium]
VIEGFTQLDEEGLERFLKERGLAMDLDDLKYCQTYFAKEKRDPTITEIKVIDTYWSDHCRHTTFGTHLNEIEIEDKNVAEAFDRYLALREDLGRADKPVTLMDMATMGARWLAEKGILTNLDVSDEINACTVHVDVDVDGEVQDWLYLFKNETHNHPTEIEPFGGAATCVGGAIRDPLSGRSYVYQAMRITGASDPTAPIEETMEGKLPQRKIVTTAAQGYSSYGNQIGLATGEVHELYHPGYAAKHMEIGAVIGATPADHVKREAPAPGDVVLLIGGRTGRDGIGGATGSSKTHTTASLETCGAEVQKGNAPEERKIQRLFRDKEASTLIKRCNDFGAGGVSVAVGELADGVDVNLDAVPKKYAGLDGTELAIAESQERMAVLVAPEDADKFIELANNENLEASRIAEVTDKNRVRMYWEGTPIVDISRDFLNTNGAPKHQEVEVAEGGCYKSPADWTSDDESLTQRFVRMASDINIASQKGLAERFDSTIGAATVLMPFGGKRQLTTPEAMVAKFPVHGKTHTCSALAWGFNPYLSEANQYMGAYCAVVESVSKLIAAGFSRQNAYLTFQEYFEKLRDDPKRWGKPVGSLLGALMAQLDLEVGAIGGKDSMSGSFEDLDVPPTLVSFATATGNIEGVISPEFKYDAHLILAISPKRMITDPDALENADGEEGILPDPESLVSVMDYVEDLIATKKVTSASTPSYGGIAQALFNMALGNGYGIEFDEEYVKDHAPKELFEPAYGTFLLEYDSLEDIDYCPENINSEILGLTIPEYEFRYGEETVDLNTVQKAWEDALESIYPYRSAGEGNAVSDTGQTEAVPQITCPDSKSKEYSGPALIDNSFGKPRVVIPVFPGNNCEYDSARAFESVGALTSTYVIKNLKPESITESADALVKEINRSQIIMIPGGFSGGDEPDGSAKFITAFFRSPKVSEAVMDLLNNRDGLILGICNGFQALIKLGLVPYGEIREPDLHSPTLTFNDIGRHQSKMVNTRICSKLSPWLYDCNVGDIYTIPISHGEGKFVADEKTLKWMIENAQVATQYVDEEGVPSMDLSVNPNGSICAIEGITSPDGRVFGKMGHSERSGFNLYKNISGALYEPIFGSGVGYFMT